MKLNDQQLQHLPSAIARPNFDRSRLQPGIVHIGVGHFQRAHQAVYLDDLFALGRDHHWAVTGMGVIPQHHRMRDTLVPQDCLYSLTKKAPRGEMVTRVIGSIVQYQHVPDDPLRSIETIADPNIGIVSLTITEGGYEIDNRTGEFVGSSASVQADLASPHATSSVFGWVLEAARLRRDRGLGGLTVMSCDNVQSNGRVAEQAFLGFAERKDPAIADWMRSNFAFPNSMVDRVVPRSVQADIDYLRDQFGVIDNCPVTCEPFRQWVLEDDFVAGRPALEDVGVEIVNDVVPYEMMKLRLANGTHQALCYFGTLLGYEFVHEAIVDPDIRRLLVRYAASEVVPTLSPILGTDFDTYASSILERFGNPEIRDQLARICQDASDRMPKFVLPVISSRLESGGEISAGVAIVASWARYLDGVTEDGRPITIDDPLSDELVGRARRRLGEPLAFVAMREVFGDLSEHPRFVDDYLAAVRVIDSDGARALLRSI